MQQYDDYFRKIHITGAGVCNVYKYFDARNRVCLGQLKEGEMCGEPSIIFDSDPQHSIEGQSYCTIGTIQHQDMLSFFGKFPKLKEKMIHKIITNPFDQGREDFVKLCKENIEFLKGFKSNDLRQLFYSCMHLFLNPAELLFDAGDVCEAVYIVLAGTVDIEITDGYSRQTRLDTLGPGSILGQHFVIKQEPWYYRATNNTIHSCSIRKILWSTI